ncbi:MAG: ubiquitin-like domain-containing protein [Defluviitaleaceae bacterium]|nr:ubiquitin-like domain-containing protein [Defluviitaleaceae bacterium]
MTKKYLAVFIFALAFAMLPFIASAHSETVYRISSDGEPYTVETHQITVAEALRQGRSGEGVAVDPRVLARIMDFLDEYGEHYGLCIDTKEIFVIRLSWYSSEVDDNFQDNGYIPIRPAITAHDIDTEARGRRASVMQLMSLTRVRHGLMSTFGRKCSTTISVNCNRQTLGSTTTCPVFNIVSKPIISGFVKDGAERI